MSTIVNKIKSLNLPSDAMITLRYEDGADVFHFNETELETAMSETSVVEEFASLISDSALDVRTRFHGNVLEHLRNEQYLDDYERDGTFEDYLADTIRDNFYDVELIDYSTEKYDHKRGFTTLTAEVEIPVGNFVQVSPFISGWSVSVDTEDGTLTFDA